MVKWLSSMDWIIRIKQPKHFTHCCQKHFLITLCYFVGQVKNPRYVNLPIQLARPSTTEERQL